MYPGELEANAKLTNKDFFSIAIDGLALQLTNLIGVEDLSQPLLSKIRDEAHRYFKTGVCQKQDDSSTVCINPSMLNPTTLDWEMHHSLCPYDGYLPLTKEELDTSAKKGILIQSCQKILQNLVSSYRRRIEAVKVHIHLKDAVEYCYSTAETFDVIDCSNLADHVGLVNMLNACQARLSDNPDAIFFTESMNWLDLSNSIAQYVEKALCSPLSMIQTIYGLRLVNHVELGSMSLPNLRRAKAQPVNLAWKKVIPFRNVELSPSPALKRCLDQLAAICFDAKFPFRLTGVPPGARSGMLCYSPFTYNYVVSSMMQRLGGESWLKEAPILPSEFQLSRRTMDAWREGETLCKFSAEIQPDKSSLLNIHGTPPLRLIFLPLLHSMKNLNFSGPGVHFIDNFHLEFRGEMVYVSCLLAPDHELKSHIAVIVDIVNGLPVYIFESWKVDKCCDLVFPFANSLRLEPSGNKELKIGSCVEFDDSYAVKIAVECDDKVISGKFISFHLKLTEIIPGNLYFTGLKVATSERKPCESSHDVTVSLSQPINVEPLTLSFSHPVFDIHATLHRKGRFIELVLMKAIQEPWPCEFQASASSRWTADNLKPWIEKKIVRPAKNPNLNSLEMHLNSQFNYLHLMNPSLMERTPLTVVRDIVRALFFNASPCIRIMYKDSSSDNPEWYLRVHQPILTSPLGGPMLMLSALDNRLVAILKREGKWDKREASKDFANIFPDYSAERLMTIEIETAQQMNLWRYFLRLNSTRILPSALQKKTVPLGEDSPWLVTFISPLYLDCPYNQKVVDDFKSAGLNETNACGACGKNPKNPKRCSRCRLVFYCSAECQRAHWAKHKLFCTK